MSEEATAGSILESTARGTGWIIGWRFTTRLLGMINTLILVRLLAPGDFGLVALGTSFAQAVETLGYIGLQDSLVREKTATRALYDTAFTLGLLRSLVTGVVVAALASPAGRFFGEPRLAAITLALAAGILMDGFSNVGAVDFRREFAFQKEFVLWVIPRVASISLSIAVALTWRSYWALVVGILSQRILRVLLSYTLHPYRARLHIGAWRGMVGYSTWAWVLALMSIVRDRTATIVIGRMLGPTAVGLFSLGFELSSLPTTELVEPLGRAAFSGFSTTRNQGLDGGDAFVRMVASMALITIPAGIGMALIADPVVRLAFGPLWVAAVPLVQMLGICGALTVFGSLSSVLFRVYGRQRLVFRVSSIVEVVRVALLVVLTRRYGLMGAGFATAVAFGIEQLYFLYLARSQFAIPVAKLAARLWRTALAASCMVGVLFASGLVAALPAGASNVALGLRAFSAAALGAACYAAALLLLWLASGRPEGGEIDMLTLIGRILRPRRLRGNAGGRA
ncbi:MAG: oligosaccharide flippase family protein [Rhodospirillales bacterium]